MKQALPWTPTRSDYLQHTILVAVIALIHESNRLVPLKNAVVRCLLVLHANCVHILLYILDDRLRFRQALLQGDRTLGRTLEEIVTVALLVIPGDGMGMHLRRRIHRTLQGTLAKQLRWTLRQPRIRWLHWCFLSAHPEKEWMCCVLVSFFCCVSEPTQSTRKGWNWVCPRENPQFLLKRRVVVGVHSACVYRSLGEDLLTVVRDTHQVRIHSIH